jgi:cytochrome P450
MAQQAGFGQMLIVTDPSRHTRMRQIINKRFSKAALAPQEPHIRAIAREILDSVTPRGQCDFVVDVAAKLPTAHQALNRASSASELERLPVPPPRPMFVPCD